MGDFVVQGVGGGRASLIARGPSIHDCNAHRLLGRHPIPPRPSPERSPVHTDHHTRAHRCRRCSCSSLSSDWILARAKNNSCNQSLLLYTGLGGMRMFVMFRRPMSLRRLQRGGRGGCINATGRATAVDTKKRRRARQARTRGTGSARAKACPANTPLAAPKRAPVSQFVSAPVCVL